MKTAKTLVYFVLILLSSSAFAEAELLSWWETGLKYHEAPGQNGPAVYYGLPRDFDLVVNDGTPLKDGYEEGKGELWSEICVGGISDQQKTKNNINKPLVILL